MIIQKSDNENRTLAANSLADNSKKQEYEAPILTSHGSVEEITKAVGIVADDGLIGFLSSPV